MRTMTNEKSRGLRRERNAELLRRMNTGESLSSFNSFSSWYPPRPIIEKNDEAIEKLYGNVARLVAKTADVDDATGPNHSRPLRLA